MSDRTPVLITGHRGYLGSVMAPYLLAHGYDVVGLDTGYFDDCTMVEDATPVEGIVKDLRDVEAADLTDVYAVIHLGALSNDPIGNLDEGWTEAINHDATMRLARLARQAGVRRFLFSSSCIMYGMSSAAVVDEASPLDPQTTYARSKVRSERGLRDLADDRFHPTCLRNGTVYGVSPRMRLDTVLNDLVAQAVTTGRVVVHSDGRPWRPVVHVEDIARTFRLVLEAPAALVADQAFNNGADSLNHQVIDLARFAAEAVEGCELEVRAQSSADQRTYRADFGKFARTFPEFRFKWDARAGARDLAQQLRRIGLTAEDHRGDAYVRLRWLTRLQAEERLDGQLRWTRQPVAS